MQKLRKRVANKTKKIIKAQEGSPLEALPEAAPEEKPDVDIEEEIADEVEDEAQMETLEDKVDRLTDKLSELVDVLADQKETIEKAILGEEGMEEKLDEFKEEESDIGDMSTSEFGIEPDELVVGTEEKKMGNLRKARKARLLKNAFKVKSEKKTAEDGSGTIAEEFDLAKDKKLTPKIPPPPNTKVTGDEPPPMFKCAYEDLGLEFDKNKKAWILLNAADENNELPLFEISAPEGSEKTFETEDFAKDLLTEMKENGIEETLQKYDAKKVKAQEVVQPVKQIVKDVVEEPKLEITETKEKFTSRNKHPKKKAQELVRYKDIKNSVISILNYNYASPSFSKPGDPTAIWDDLDTFVEVTAKEFEIEDLGEIQQLKENMEKWFEEWIKEKVEGTEDTQVETEDNFKRRFSRAFRLSLSKMSKNMTKSNPLKATLFNILKTSAGMEEDEIVTIIEAAFGRSAADHFEVALEETERHLNMSDEAFVELEAEIGELPTASVNPGEVEIHSSRKLSKQASDLQKQAARSSLPLVTATKEKEHTLADVISRAMPKPKILHAREEFAKIQGKK